jgi:hypothetical protein
LRAPRRRCHAHVRPRAHGVRLKEKPPRKGLQDGFRRWGICPEGRGTPR